MKVAVIGGGAAGFFSAIASKQYHKGADVTIYEKSSKTLSKVKVSGGGRCNVTHACFNIPTLSKYYPRGEKHLKKAFYEFSTEDTVKWFEEKGVKLKTEPDGRIFPVSNSSQTIVDCLMNRAEQLGVNLKLNANIISIDKPEECFVLTQKDSIQTHVDKVIVTTGGNAKLESFNWLKKLGHTIEIPIPSLFTFNMPKEKITQLMGLSVDNALVRVQSTKLKHNGPLLITHWGMSGPVILALSSIGARQLFQSDYHFNIQVSWVGHHNESQVRSHLTSVVEEHGKRNIVNKNPFNLPKRLWEYLLEKTALDNNSCYEVLKGKNLNRLVNILINDIYKVEGKTTFKEEFVTCGGVSLKDVDIKNMESKVCDGLHFAGEVLDIDGLTGGFNFQAAWTTGFIAGKSIC